MQELTRTNPGTTVRIEAEPVSDPKTTTRQFKRIYICLGSLKNGFKAIGRDFIGLDGAFMKGPFPGQILSAVGVDPMSHPDRWRNHRGAMKLCIRLFNSTWINIGFNNINKLFYNLK